MQFGKNEKAPKVCFVLNEILFVIGFITIANVYFFSKVLSFFLNSTFQNTNRFMAVVNCHDSLQKYIFSYSIQKPKCQRGISQCANISCIVFITQSKRHFLVEPYDYFLPISFPRQTPLLFFLFFPHE